MSDGRFETGATKRKVVFESRKETFLMEMSPRCLVACMCTSGGLQMRILRKLILVVAAIMVAMFVGNSVGNAQNVTFPGGSVTWGADEGRLTYPGGDVNLRPDRGSVNLPGSIGVNWDALGRGGVNISIPGAGFRTNIRW